MADEEKTRQTQIEAEKGWLRLPVYHSLDCTVGGDEPCTCFVGAFRARLNALEAKVALLADCKKALEAVNEFNYLFRNSYGEPTETLRLVTSALARIPPSLTP